MIEKHIFLSFLLNNLLNLPLHFERKEIALREAFILYKLKIQPVISHYGKS